MDVSSCIFPPPADPAILTTAITSPIHQDHTIVEYLKISAHRQPNTGFGSMPLFVNDTLQVEDKNWAGKWDHGNSVQYCLACTESYEGILGWDACDGFTRNTTTERSTLFDLSDSGRYTVNALSKDFSAAVCTFALLETNTYNLTVAYPFINRPRDVSESHTFSKTTPEGIEISSANIFTNPQRNDISELQHILTKRQRNDTNMPEPNQAGPIVGIIIAIVIALGICFGLCRMHSMREEKHRAASRYKHDSTLRTDLSGITRPPPTRRPGQGPRPLVRDRLSRAEQGEAGVWRRTDTDEMPPPAYEEVVADVARQAENGERENR